MMRAAGESIKLCIVYNTSSQANDKAPSLRSRKRKRERPYKESYRKCHSSEEKRTKCNAHQRKDRMFKASLEESAKANAYLKNYRAKKLKRDTQFYISKFRELVSQGPLYICSCCDQM